MQQIDDVRDHPVELRLVCEIWGESKENIESSELGTGKCAITDVRRDEGEDNESGAICHDYPIISECVDCYRYSATTLCRGRASAC